MALTNAVIRRSGSAHNRERFYALRLATKSQAKKGDTGVSGVPSKGEWAGRPLNR